MKFFNGVTALSALSGISFAVAQDMVPVNTLYTQLVKFTTFGRPFHPIKSAYVYDKARLKAAVIYGDAAHVKTGEDRFSTSWIGEPAPLGYHPPHFATPTTHIDKTVTVVSVSTATAYPERNVPRNALPDEDETVTVLSTAHARATATKWVISAPKEDYATHYVAISGTPSNSSGADTGAAGQGEPVVSYLKDGEAAPPGVAVETQMIATTTVPLEGIATHYENPAAATKLATQVVASVTTPTDSQGKAIHFIKLATSVVPGTASSSTWSTSSTTSISSSQTSSWTMESSWTSSSAWSSWTSPPSSNTSSPVKPTSTSSSADWSTSAITRNSSSSNSILAKPTSTRTSASPSIATSSTEITISSSFGSTLSSSTETWSSSTPATSSLIKTSSPSVPTTSPLVKTFSSESLEDVSFIITLSNSKLSTSSSTPKPILTNGTSQSSPHMTSTKPVITANSTSGIISFSYAKSTSDPAMANNITTMPPVSTITESYFSTKYVTISQECNTTSNSRHCPMANSTRIYRTTWSSQTTHLITPTLSSCLPTYYTTTRTINTTVTDYECGNCSTSPAYVVSPTTICKIFTVPATASWVYPLPATTWLVSNQTTTSCAPPVYTTSTIYATSIATVTVCPSHIPNCPSGSTAIQTHSVPFTTTVCPVSDVIPTPSTPSAPAPVAPTPNPPYPMNQTTTTRTETESCSSSTGGAECSVATEGLPSAGCNTTLTTQIGKTLTEFQTETVTGTFAAITKSKKKCTSTTKDTQSPSIPAEVIPATGDETTLTTQALKTSSEFETETATAVIPTSRPESPEEETPVAPTVSFTYAPEESAESTPAQESDEEGASQPSEVAQQTGEEEEEEEEQGEGEEETEEAQPEEIEESASKEPESTSTEESEGAATEGPESNAPEESEGGNDEKPEESKEPEITTTEEPEEPEEPESTTSEEPEQSEEPESDTTEEAEGTATDESEGTATEEGESATTGEAESTATGKVEGTATSEAGETATNESSEPTTAPVSSMAGFGKKSVSVELVAFVAMAAFLL